MATDQIGYASRHPGPRGRLDDRRLHFDPGRPGGRFPYNDIAKFLECDMGAVVGGGFPYLDAQWTIVDGGTGDAHAQATTSGGGVLITTPSDDDFNVCHDWLSGVATPVSAKYYFLMARIQVDDADKIGFRIGMTTGNAVQALPFTTDYTDQITISKAITATAVLGKVRGNSGTAADTGTLGTLLDATEIEVGFLVYMHATTMSGQWYYNGLRTPFTAAQLTAVGTILTTPPTMYWGWNATGVTGATHTLLITSLLSGRSR